MFLQFTPADGTVYDTHLNAIKYILSLVSDTDLLIVLGDFNLPDVKWIASNLLIPDNSDSFIDGLSELSLVLINPVQIIFTGPSTCYLYWILPIPLYLGLTHWFCQKSHTIQFLIHDRCTQSVF